MVESGSLRHRNQPTECNPTAAMSVRRRLAAPGEVWAVDLSDALWPVVGSVGCEQGNGPSQLTAENGGLNRVSGRFVQEFGLFWLIEYLTAGGGG